MYGATPHNLHHTIPCSLAHHAILCTLYKTKLYRTVLHQTIPQHITYPQQTKQDQIAEQVYMELAGANSALRASGGAHQASNMEAAQAFVFIQ